MNYSAINHPEKSIYTVDLGNDDQALLKYSKNGDELMILHTEVPAHLRGGGYGKILMETVLKELESQNLRVVPICSYARIYMQRNSQWHHLLGQQ
ncbi:MAG: GNAT family N-acetyltransferase [Chloroflexota bacterium]